MDKWEIGPAYASAVADHPPYQSVAGAIKQMIENACKSLPCMADSQACHTLFSIKFSHLCGASWQSFYLALLFGSVIFEVFAISISLS